MKIAMFHHNFKAKIVLTGLMLAGEDGGRYIQFGNEPMHINKGAVRHMPFHGKPVILVAFLFISCATYGTTGNSPELRGAVLEDFCAWLIEKGDFEFGQKVHIPKRTVGLVDIFALHILSAGESLTPEDAFADDELSSKLRETLNSMPIVLPKARSSCSWKLEDNIRDARKRRELSLEISSPLKNPYAVDPAQEIGVFARISAGTLGGFWYWIVLDVINGEWDVKDIMPLDISGL